MKVLIATDGSEASLLAASESVVVLGADAEFVMAMVIDEQEDPMADAGGFEGPVSTDQQVRESYRESVVGAEGALARSARAFGATPLRQRIVERSGGPIGGRICALAVEEQVDVIVVGSHGHRALVDVLLGSVSSYVLHHSPCPVLLIRR